MAEGFDLAAYQADPGAYCQKRDGSRCRQVAQPGLNTPALESVGGGGFVLRPGGRARLQARTDPGMPVSFSSMGLGRFPAAGGATITAQADADGLATAEFEASAGTVGHCQIIAGSPVRAGTVEYLITIRE